MFLRYKGPQTCRKYNMKLYSLINLIFLCIVNGFFTFFGIFLNSVAIISLWRSAQLRKGTGNFMILVLSSFDLLVIIVGHPTVILSAVPWSTGDNSLAHWSKFLMLASNFAHCFSMYALLAMTTDRYLAITRPFFHHAYVTKRRLLAIIVIMQFLFFALRMFLRFFDELKAVNYISLLVFGAIPIFLLVVLNIRMYQIVTKLRTKRNEQAFKTQTAVLKKNYTCLLTGFCFFVSITPSGVYAVFRATSTALLSEDALRLILLWGNTSLSMRSTWNCVIFFWRNEILRKAGAKLVSSCLKPRC